MCPLSSNLASWRATEEELDSPTASPISRMDGAYPVSCMVD